MSAWMGVFAPPNTPPAIVRSLASALQKIMTDPQFNERLKKEGLEAFYSGPEEFAAFLSSETAAWAKLVSEAGIEAQ
jgi:tripartite-type tricarboxylate transporter receptor subunit TctC